MGYPYTTSETIYDCFDPIYYLYLNPEIDPNDTFTIEDSLNHYINIGQHSNLLFERTLINQDQFSHVIYNYFNSNLILDNDLFITDCNLKTSLYASNLERLSKVHFVRVGSNEETGEQLRHSVPENFNVQLYRMFHSTEIDVTVITREEHYIDYLKRRIRQRVVIGSVDELETYISENLRIHNLLVENELTTLGNAYFFGTVGVSGVIEIDGQIVLENNGNRNDVFNFPQNIPFLYTSNTLSIRDHLLVGSRDTPWASNESYFLNRVTMNSNLDLYGHLATSLITNLSCNSDYLRMQAPFIEFNAGNELIFNSSNLAFDSIVNFDDTVYFNSNIIVKGHTHLKSDLIVDGNFISFGSNTIINTDIKITEQIIASNIGTGPALIVEQYGDCNIAEFYDDGFPLLTVRNDKKVGIGVNSVSNNYMLEVGSNIKINGFIDATDGLKTNHISSYSSSEILFDSDVLFNGHMNISSNVFIGNTLDVFGTTTFNSNLIVSNDVFFNDSLYVLGDTIFDSNLTVSSNVTINNELIVFGATTLHGTLILTSNVSIGDSLEVEGTTTLNSNLIVGDEVSLGDTLDVIGTTTLNSNLIVVKEVSLSDTLDVVGTTTLNSNLIVGDEVSLSDTLDVVGTTTLNSNLIVGDDVSLSDTLDVVGTTTLNSNLIVGDEVSLSDTLDVVGTTTLNSNLVVVNDVKVYEHLVVDGRVNVGEPTEDTTDYKISVNGLVRASGYYLRSDERIKHNISDLDEELSYKLIKNVQVREYDLINEISYSQEKRNIGVIAQELEDVLHENGLKDTTIVNTGSSYIPNILKKIKCDSKEHNMVKISKRDMLCNDGKYIEVEDEIQIINTSSSTVMYSRIMEIVTNNEDEDDVYLIFDKYFKMGDEYMLYGKKEDDVKSVDYTQLFCVMLKCMQKMMKENRE